MYHLKSEKFLLHPTSQRQPPLTVWCLSSRFFPTHLLCNGCSLCLGYSSPRSEQGSFLHLLQVVLKLIFPGYQISNFNPANIPPSLFVFSSVSHQTNYVFYLFPFLMLVSLNEMSAPLEQEFI